MPDMQDWLVITCQLIKFTTLTNERGKIIIISNAEKVSYKIQNPFKLKTEEDSFNLIFKMYKKSNVIHEILKMFSLK